MLPERLNIFMFNTLAINMVSGGGDLADNIPPITGKFDSTHAYRTVCY
jgi:hypothetical protein